MLIQEAAAVPAVWWGRNIPAGSKPWLQWNCGSRSGDPGRHPTASVTAGDLSHTLSLYLSPFKTAFKTRSKSKDHLTPRPDKGARALMRSHFTNSSNDPEQQLSRTCASSFTAAAASSGSLLPSKFKVNVWSVRVCGREGERV